MPGISRSTINMPSYDVHHAHADTRLQGIVNHHALCETGVIVLNVAGESQRNSQQTCTLWGEIQPVSVGTTHNDGEIEWREIGQRIFP